MAYYKKYYYTFRDLNNSKYTVEIHEDIDTQMTYNVSVVTYTNKNYIYVAGDISMFGVGDSIDNIGSGIPNGAIITGIDASKNWVYLNATATVSNPPVLATLHKAVPVPEQVRVGDNPFTIIYPEIESKFQSVRGCGFSFNLLSEVNMKFIGLSTGDMQKYMVKLIEEVYITPLYTQDIVRFIGYLNSEIYEEPFDSMNNYLVNFTGNNGFSLLERFNYVSTSGSKFDTVSSIFNTIFNIFFKVGLPYKKLFVGLSTTIDGFTLPATDTILHHLYNNPDNWYNEDGDSESQRTVLEKLLGVLGAYIMTIDDNVYITDMNYILGAEGEARAYKVYDFENNLSYLNTTQLYMNVGDLSTIGFKSDKQDYKIVSGINKQVINFNNYRITDVIDYSADKDGLYQQNTTEAVDLIPEYKYNLTKFDASKTWNSYNGSNFIFFEGTGSENLKQFESGIRFEPKTDSFGISPEHLSFSTKVDLPYLIDTDEYKLKVEATVHPHTWKYFGLAPKQEDLAENETIIAIDINAEFIIDNEVGAKKKYYNPNYQFVSGAISPWVDESSASTCKLRFSKPTKYILEKDNNWNFRWEYEALNDKDAELLVWRKSPTTTVDGEGNIVYEMQSSPYYIPLNSGVSGRLVINLYDYELRFLDFTGAAYLPEGYTTTNFFNFFLKDLKLTVVDKFNNEIKKLDVEFIGDSKNSPISSIYKDEGAEITTLIGSNAGSYPVDNATLLKYNSGGFYEPCLLFNRQGKTNMIEMLLLRSVISNYYKPFINLNLTTNRLEKYLGYLTYNNYLSGKKFTITSLTRNIAEASDELQIQEFSEDNIEINYYPNVGN